MESDSDFERKVHLIIDMFHRIISIMPYALHQFKKPKQQTQKTTVLMAFVCMEKSHVDRQESTQLRKGSNFPRICQAVLKPHATTQKDRLDIVVRMLFWVVSPPLLYRLTLRSPLLSGNS